MSSNAPDPTEHEGGDPEVAEARHTVMEWLGNTATIEPDGNVLAAQSPLALGIFVTAALHGMRDDSFTEVEIATARGEVAYNRRARELLELALEPEPEDTQKLLDGLLLPDVPERDRRVRRTVYTRMDTTTNPYRQYVQDAIAYRDLKNIDWHKLADDMCDEPPAWKSFTEDHDTRGCYDCLRDVCLVGLEDVDETDGGEPEPDREAIEREAAFRLKASTMD